MYNVVLALLIHVPFFIYFVLLNRSRTQNSGSLPKDRSVRMNGALFLHSGIAQCLRCVLE